ncbi:MAG: Hsp20/alpha crystallin family protein [Candidatus Odinarchaeota archaeon]
MSDDFDDFIDEIKKNFKIDSDIFDIDFLFIPESKNNLGIKPEKKNIKGFKVSYHFESGMDKPEIKVEGKIDENRIRELLKGMDISKYPKLKNMFKAKSVNEYDANMLSLETQEHKENFEYLEPQVEINDYKDCSEIVFEIPGMNKEDIKIDINEGGDQLTFKAENKNRKYMKTIQLPFISSLKDCDTEVKNGLAIILVKKLDK